VTGRRTRRFALFSPRCPSVQFGRSRSGDLPVSATPARLGGSLGEALPRCGGSPEALPSPAKGFSGLFFLWAEFN